MDITYDDNLARARAHSLAISRIPGLHVATVKVRRDGDLLDETLLVCVGHCHKCDSFWRNFRVEPSLILEVVEVGFAEAATPA